MAVGQSRTVIDPGIPARSVPLSDASHPEGAHAEGAHPRGASPLPDTAPPAESWLVRFRPWLTLIARTQIDQGFQGKFDASDIAQQTLIEAWRSAAQFRGQSEAERIAWLRQILAHVLAHEMRRYCGTLKRDVGRELSLEKSIEQSSQRLDGILVSAMTSPSQQAANREQQVLLAETLEKLPADYRQVLVLRHVEGLSHDEIAQRHGTQRRSGPDAVDARPRGTQVPARRSLTLVRSAVVPAMAASRLPSPICSPRWGSSRPAPAVWRPRPRR